jgi:hypothetical protein
MALLGSINQPVSPSQQPSTVAPLPGRPVLTPQVLPVPTVQATIFLSEAPLETVAQAARAEGLSELQLATRLTFYSLRLVALHNNLINTLTSPPISAVVLDQSYAQQNSITVQVLADQVPQIQALPGVLSVDLGRNPEAAPLQPTEISREHRTPGTRIEPPIPPGFD